MDDFVIPISLFKRLLSTFMNFLIFILIFFYAFTTFILKFIIGLVCGAVSHKVIHLRTFPTGSKLKYVAAVTASAFSGLLVNVFTDPFIGYFRNLYIFGQPAEFVSVVTKIAMEHTQQHEGYAEYETAMAAFDLVDPIYRKAVEYTRPLAAKWAEQNADKPCINVMAQGPLFGAAYVFSICNVQEMLQIDSCTINTCDFFHGPFEILDKRASLFQLLSVGRSRCTDGRGVRFDHQYGGERVYQLDAKELGLNDIKDSVSEYFNHLIFAPILNNVYMRALSVVTHKDYMTRRYMWKLEY